MSRDDNKIQLKNVQNLTLAAGIPVAWKLVPNTTEHIDVNCRIN